MEEEMKEALVAAACKAREQAYAPYSEYKVGAAVLTEGGRIYTGVNVENAAYGSTICGERAAVFAAVTDGHRRILAVAVCTEHGASPCGACRQVIGEFAGNIPIYMSDHNGKVHDGHLRKLLPHRFGPEDLL